MLLVGGGGGDEEPSSPYPEPISNQICFIPIFKPAAKILNTDKNKKISSEWYIAICSDSLLSVYLEWKRQK